jgi:predicted phage terminase large subunit-like protein
MEHCLIKFTEYFFNVRGDTFVDNWHHYEIANSLAKVESGEIKNLLINMPPRYGKTELAVINWVAQCIAKNPKSKFIHLSYSDDLALDNSGKAKELINSDEFQELWPVKLKEDSQSKKKWYTVDGGGLYATAAGGPITGFGAGSTDSDEFSGAIIIDDPIKVDDAEREGERERVNNRLNTTIKSRRNNRNTPIIIIMQRLHEDDMSGYVLAGKMGEEFHHLKLPAIKDGRPLWEFKHTLEDLEKERLSDPRTFSGQMMQDPSPDDGEFFKRDWFKRFDIGAEPKTWNYICSDYAVTEGGGDFTEHGVGGFDKIEDLWLLDWWSGQTTPDKWIDEEIRIARKYAPLVAAAEGGVIRKSVEPFLKREMERSGIYYRKEWISSNKDKAANARAFQALASQGKVHIPNNAWGEELISQLLKFPAGKYDDKVDVCGLFGRLLDQTFGPREAVKEIKPLRDGYETDSEDDQTWKMM